jgi:DNA-binding NarL/FixJ family response regulator
VEQITLLVVDDEPDIRLLLRSLIEREDGLKVVGEAADGAEALAAVEEYDPNVIVIDERMPMLGGIETSTILLERRPDRKIVLCTAYLDDALQARADAIGISSCVTKGDALLIPELARLLARSA